MSNYNFFLKPQNVPKIKSKFRKIQTSVPAYGTENIISRLNKVESRSMHGQIPIVWSKAHNFNIYDIAEKCYQKGLLVVHTGRESIKIGPPLSISLEALKEGVEVIRQSLLK